MAWLSGSKPGVDRHHAGLIVLAEAAGVVLIDDCAAGEDHDAILLGDRDRKFGPMREVAADGVPPAHMSPLISEGIVLKKQMKFAVKIH